MRDLARQYRFFHWHLEFPGIFTVPERRHHRVDPATGWQGGFSCVIGNPPWERVKIQDKEFFADVGRTDIADAKTAAIRKKMIDELADDDPHAPRCLPRRPAAVRRHSHLLLQSGRYPLTGQGDVNTYSVFAETMRTIIAPDRRGRDHHPDRPRHRQDHRAVLRRHPRAAKRLLAFYDFENEAKIFRDVHHRVPLRGHRDDRNSTHGRRRTRFAFLTRHIADVPDRDDSSWPPTKCWR